MFYSMYDVVSPVSVVLVSMYVGICPGLGKVGNDLEHFAYTDRLWFGKVQPFMTMTMT